MSSILIGASILFFATVGALLMMEVEEMTEPVSIPPVSTGISTLVSVDVPPIGYEFEEEWQKPWRTTYDMLIAKGIDHMNVAYYDHMNDQFCVLHVTYIDGREFCWDGQSESFSVR